VSMSTAKRLLAMIEAEPADSWESPEAREEILELARECVKHEEYTELCRLEDEAHFEALKRSIEDEG